MAESRRDGPIERVARPNPGPRHKPSVRREKRAKPASAGDRIVPVNEPTKTRAALAQLTEVLASIARTADEKNRERCPYKTKDDLCTYHGGCQNQRLSHFALGTSHSCAGDHLDFSPSAQRPEPHR